MKRLVVKADVLPLAITAVLLSTAAVPLHAQDDFGFGFGDTPGGEAAIPADGGSLARGMTVGGEVSAELLLFTGELESKKTLKNIRVGDIFSGALNFKASGSNADAVIDLNLSPNVTDPAQILSIDEAYVRAFYGNFNIEGGLRKLTWGKADTLGPLDVINPLDYTDLSNMTDIQSIKIARPLLHASYGIGNFSKIEGVFVPWFESARFSQDGRWAPVQVSRIAGNIEGQIRSDLYSLLGGMLAANPGVAPIVAAVPSPIEGVPIDQGSLLPDTSALEYVQGGLRFTTTIGQVDLGLQYYNGFLSRPAVTVAEAGYAELLRAVQDYYTAYVTEIMTGGTVDTASVAAAPAKASVEAALTPGLFDAAYNRYHQIGLDYAQVLLGFNLRAELAANITSDLAGDDGLVYNPSVVWSVGFDRDIPAAGITVNLQVNESIRLLDDRVGDEPVFDIEAGTNVTSTRLIASLSRSFFRNALELRATAIWGIEDSDCYIIPAITWTKGDVTLEVSAGIFAGNREGELGQYRDNSFVKTALSYSF